MASSARIDEIKKKFDENPRRYFAPLANEFRKTGDLDQAIMICEEFLPQQAGHMSGHIVYGQALYESGRLPESRTVFETALGLDPENLIALRHLGDIARSEGQLADARRWYDRVLEADPRNEEILGLIGSLDGATPVSGVVGDRSAGSSDAASDGPTLVMESPVARAHHAAPPPELATIDLDLDDAAFGPPATAPAAGPAQSGGTPPTTASHAAFDAISLDGLEPTSSTGPASTRHARAEGLEPSEFEAPDGPSPRAEGLEPGEFESPAAHPARAEGLEISEFEAPSPSSSRESLLDTGASFDPGLGSFAGLPSLSGAPVAPVSGLEEAGATHPPEPERTESPALVLDDGTTAGPQGDNLVAADPVGAEQPWAHRPSTTDGLPYLQLDDAAPSAAPDRAPVLEQPDSSAEPMMELPAAVIAAESQIMDHPQSYDLGGHDDSREEESGFASPPFVTETMAELYLKQGFRDQALVVYRQLSDASPTDERLRARVAELEPAPGMDEPAGPTIREFFARLAARRPGERGAASEPPSNDDFASFEPVPERVVEPEPVPEAVAAGVPEYESEAEPLADATPLHGDPEPLVPEPVAASTSVAASPMASAAERAVVAQGGGPSAGAGGTIDALFGNRAVGTSEDSAASALAQAFSGSMEVIPAITGRPARAASGELSLDSVFRDGPSRPPRTSQSFSFDQFFSESAATEVVSAPVASAGSASRGDASAEPVAASGEPAERSADDIQQFNSWLQRLKQR